MNIYVGNLSPEITEAELRREFVTFGKVTSVTLMNDLDIGSGQGRRCGYIEMPSAQEGESAIEQLQGKSVKGHQLDIIKALPLTRNYATDNIDGMKASGFSRKNRNGAKKLKLSSNVRVPIIQQRPREEARTDNQTSL